MIHMLIRTSRSNTTGMEIFRENESWSAKKAANYLSCDRDRRVSAPSFKFINFDRPDTQLYHR